ncbi:MAG: DnaD domain protein [Clostridiales bacterium]|nr:DnaD domain protein [Eubacteriales bacterium]MDH7566281.1 DnaD domain protein [Clostridiales bacterium]
MFFESYKSILYSDTLVPDIFITEYMPSMDGDYVKVYIKCLFLSKYNKTATTEELSKGLNIDVNKVKEALTYFQNLGIATWKENSLSLTDLKEKEINKIYRMKTVSTPEEAVLSSERNKKRNSIVTAINNAFFQGMMPPSWYTDIDTWFDRYNFDEDVMFALFQHCYNYKALSKNYIVAVAESWHRKNIKNSFDLDNYSIEYQKFKDIRGKIFKKLKRQVPFTEYEEECIEKWVTEYKYDFDIIELALKKTIAKPEAAFKYIDTIITDWHDNGLKTKEEIAKYDAEKKRAVKPKTEAGVHQRGNFEQRKYDDEFYENLYDNVRKSKTV